MNVLKVLTNYIKIIWKYIVLRIQDVYGENADKEETTKII